MIQIGDKPAGFALSDQAGAQRSWADLRGRPVVLFFYPKASTPGCTTEACDFRDLWSAFDALGVGVFGVSADTPRRQLNFATKHALPMPLLADEEHAILAPWGIWAEKKNYGKTYMGIIRTTILFDAEGVVQEVWSPVRVKGHAQAVLERVTTSIG